LRSILLAAFLLLAVPAAAATGSRYLPLDDPAYEGIRLLQEAGYLAGLDPLLQPYRRADVTEAVAALDPDAMPPGPAHWARLLQAEFPPANPRSVDALRWGSWIEGGARGSTSRRFDAIRPLGDANKGWPFGRAEIGFSEGPLAADLVLLADRYLTEDPDGLDPQRRIGRSETAYLSFAFPHGEVLVGRLARNWGMLGTPGLMVGSSPTPYPQLGLTVEAGRFRLRSFVGQLDTLAAAKRYLAAHRMDLVWPNLILSFGESILFAGDRAGFSLRDLSPIDVFYFDSDARPQDVTQNLMLDWSAWWRRGPVQAYLEFLLDDVDLTPPKGADREPTSYAVTLGGRWAAGEAPVTVGFEYNRVSAWAYRTPNLIDRYSYLGRGLGANYSDFDRASLFADWLPPVTGLRLTPEVQVLRQGEGSFRVPVPDPVTYHASPNVFLGTIETTVRGGVAGRYQPSRLGWIGWDLGVNRTTNYEHESGRNRTAFEATAELGVRFDVVKRW
jgi:hypothetical protein